jgi:murein DD-endopeptidase MepM/ murein hydrolase activator NlpD
VRRKQRKRNYLVAFGSICFAIGFAVHLLLTPRNTQQAAQVADYAPPADIAPLVAAIDTSFPHLLPARSNLSRVLREMNVDSKTIHQITTAAKPVTDLARLNAGTRFRLLRLTDLSSELVGIDFLISPVERIEIRKVNAAWVAARKLENVEAKVVSFKGVVKSSLWESASVAKMDPILIVQMAEIFGWKLDFARELTKGDQWRLTVEQKLVNGKPVGWGSILAAEYRSKNRNFTAALYKSGDKIVGYFAPDGSSLRGKFLKSPLQFGRVTSGFQKSRFHPILKFARPHLGVDYGAPTGTPVRALGDGSVTFVGANGAGGNTIRLRHGSQYQTVYMHLSRFEKGVRAGSSVKQGQVIGYVGKTGSATGPHLHFEFHQDGRVLDPLKVKTPSAEPIDPAHLSDFKRSIALALRRLPPWGREIASLKRQN